MEDRATGAKLAAGWLKDHGIDRVFSLSGNQIMPLYDALFETGIEIVHTRHEAGAAYMADAWSRVTGKPVNLARNDVHAEHLFFRHAV